jgi:hypothetical protein
VIPNQMNANFSQKLQKSPKLKVTFSHSHLFTFSFSSTKRTHKRTLNTHTH